MILCSVTLLAKLHRRWPALQLEHSKARHGVQRSRPMKSLRIPPLPALVSMLHPQLLPFSDALAVNPQLSFQPPLTPSITCSRPALHIPNLVTQHQLQHYIHVHYTGAARTLTRQIFLPTG